MKNTVFATASIVALSAGFGAADAQETLPDDEARQDTVVVVGIRANLDNAINAKRNADQVLDSLDVGDVGELPTISIADSLEFLPGVVGTRFRGNVDEISLRGLPQLFTQSTVNGRELTSGDGGRFVRYRIYPTSFFTKAQLSKSPLPDQVEGGIAGTIDLQTPTALGYAGPAWTADVRLQHSPFNDNNDLIDSNGWRAHGQFRKSFDVENGEVGIVLGLDYMDNPITIGQAFLPSFSPRTIQGQSAVVPNVGLFSNDTEEFDRLAGLAVFEFESNSGAKFKLDGLFTSADNPQQRTFLQINNLNAPNRYVTADIQGGELQSGQLQNLLVLSRFEDLDRTDEAYMLGANFQKSIGAWDVEVDGFLSQTDVDFQLVRPLFRNVGVGVDFDFTGGQLRFANFSEDLTDPSQWGAHQLFAFDRQVEDQSGGLRLDVGRKLDGFFTAVDFGVRYSQREIESLEIQSNDVSVRNAGLFPELAIGALDSSLFADPYIDFNLQGDTAGAFPSPFAIFNRGAARAALPDPVFEASNADLLNRSVDNKEETWAAFARADFETSLSGRRLSGVAGIRVVNTEVTASGFSGDPIAVTDPVTSAVTIEVPGDLVEAQQTNDYTEVLPSLNLKFDISEEWVARLGVARTLARPNFLDLRLAQNLNGGDVDAQPFTGSAGNPNLDPIISDQLDISFEWYPRDGTAFTAGVYYKDVSGFIITDVRATEINGFSYDLSSPINADDGEFYGIELSLRHDLDYLPEPLDGLGFQVNATFNETSLEPEYGILTDKDDVTGDFLFDVEDRDPGVEGFAERTGSALVYYEKGPFSARASARYTSDRVRNVASLNVPIVSDDRTLYDFGASYQLNENIRLQFQALNLTEEADEGYFAFDNYTAVSQQTGRTFFFGTTLRF